MKQEIKDLMAADLEPLELHRVDTYTKEGNILFSWPKRNRWRVFSNFWPCEFTTPEGTFHSVEQYYHFKRISEKRFRDKLMTYEGEKNGHLCYAYAHSRWVKPHVEMDFDKRCRYIWEGLVLKATVCPEFVEKLKALSEKTIVEHITWESHADIFGAQPQSEEEKYPITGYNALGKMLMELRIRIDCLNA